jgi:hypothetical protein
VAVASLTASPRGEAALGPGVEIRGSSTRRVLVGTSTVQTAGVGRERIELRDGQASCATLWSTR